MPVIWFLSRSSYGLTLSWTIQYVGFYYGTSVLIHTTLSKDFLRIVKKHRYDLGYFINILGSYSAKDAQCLLITDARGFLQISIFLSQE